MTLASAVCRLASVPPTTLSEQVMVRLDPPTRARLEAHAEQVERSVAQVIRLAIRDYLEAAA